MNSNFDRFYKDTQLKAKPFFVVPVASMNLESGLIFGPEKFKDNLNAITKIIFGQNSSIFCTNTCAVFIFEKDVIIANIIQSDVIDGNSARQGLYLAYGAAIDLLTFKTSCGICTKIFAILNDYITTEFQINPMEDSFNAIVRRFQDKDKKLPELITPTAIRRVFQQFESSFNSNHNKDSGNLYYKVFGKANFIAYINQFDTFTACYDFNAVSLFWQEFDKEIFDKFAKSKENKQLDFVEVIVKLPKTDSLKIEIIKKSD